MCDYSLQSIASRPAKVGDKLTTKNFGTGTSGFCDQNDPALCVCVLPGTEIAFEAPIATRALTLVGMVGTVESKHKLAIFRQLNKERGSAHHDALEFPDGQIVLLTSLSEGQQATVLQLPAEPVTAVETEAQRRVAFVG